MGMQAYFGKLERMQLEGIDKYYENEVEDEKVFIEEGDNFYSSFVNQVTMDQFGMAIYDDKNTVFQIDYQDYNNLQIMFDSEE